MMRKTRRIGTAVTLVGSVRPCARVFHIVFFVVLFLLHNLALIRFRLLPLRFSCGFFIVVVIVVGIAALAAPLCGGFGGDLTGKRATEVQ
jgi:hypothetical protein